MMCVCVAVCYMLVKNVTVTEQSEALEQVGAERPDVLVY